MKTAFFFTKAAFFYSIESQEEELEGNKWEEVAESKTHRRKAFKEREIVPGLRGILSNQRCFFLTQLPWKLACFST